MKKLKQVLMLLLALSLILAFSTVASAMETTEASVPVVLTVVNTVKPISVTVPAAMPISVIDGKVVCAQTAKIVNNGERAIRVSGISIQAGGFEIGNYENFTGKVNSIALCINGCGTQKAGPLVMKEDAFPTLVGGESLPIRYSAKVSAASTVTNVGAATVIFTIGEA